MSELAVSDTWGFGLVMSFGMWWVVLPSSVIRFYTWFHRGKVSMPRPGAVRCIGGLWILLVLVVYWVKL